MKIEVRTLEKFTVFDLIGTRDKEIDKENYDEFETELQKNQDLILKTLEDQIRRGNTQIVLNLLNAEYIHSGGIGVLTRSLRRILDAKGQLFIIVKNPHVQDTIKMIGLEKSLPVYTSEEKFKKAQKIK